MPIKYGNVRQVFYSFHIHKIWKEEKPVDREENREIKVAKVQIHFEFILTKTKNKSFYCSSRPPLSFKRRTYEGEPRPTNGSQPEVEVNPIGQQTLRSAVQLFQP